MSARSLCQSPSGKTRTIRNSSDQRRIRRPALGRQQALVHDRRVHGRIGPENRGLPVVQDALSEFALPSRSERGDIRRAAWTIHKDLTRFRAKVVAQVTAQARVPLAQERVQILGRLVVLDQHRYLAVAEHPRLLQADLRSLMGSKENVIVRCVFAIGKLIGSQGAA